MSTGYGPYFKLHERVSIASQILAQLDNEEIKIKLGRWETTLTNKAPQRNGLIKMIKRCRLQKYFDPELLKEIQFYDKVPGRRLSW